MEDRANLVASRENGADRIAEPVHDFLDRGLPDDQERQIGMVENQIAPCALADHHLALGLLNVVGRAPAFLAVVQDRLDVGFGLEALEFDHPVVAHQRIGRATDFLGVVGHKACAGRVRVRHEGVERKCLALDFRAALHPPATFPDVQGLAGVKFGGQRQGDLIEQADIGDIPFFLDDGAGNSVARTPKQVLDDIANDEVLMKEFETCVGFGA